MREPRLGMSLGMSLIVRDEADIVAQNIAFHAASGVEAFAVLDNGSKDGTRDILLALSRRFNIALFEDRAPLDQAKWATFLARHLASEMACDYIISNDADEFWVAEAGDIRRAIRPGSPVMRVRRKNLLPRARDVASANYRFYNAILAVEKPLGWQAPVTDPDVPLAIPMLMRDLPGKILCAASGLRRVQMGNHQVDHDGGEARDISGIAVFHYPLRHYARFESKVRNHGDFLHLCPPDTAWHARRWWAACRRGTLRAEYDAMIPSDADAARYLASGALCEDRTLEKLFEPAVAE